MANQPKKYKKFVATAATATLVASAIVPVASAASFSDVDASNSHAEAINALVAEGIINGYQDGTFKPNGTLTRGHVVKMLGKWVEAQGFAVPADWNTVARFSDLAVNAVDQELVKYAAVVKDAGVFNGSNGELNARGSITRENMALTLDRAYAAVFGQSLVEEAAGLQNITVSDLATAKEESRAAIQALRNLGVSNVDTFNPKAAVTRAQFASFLYRTINVEGNQTTPPTGEVAIASLKATAVNQLTVEFNQAVDTAAAAFAVKQGTTTDIKVSDVEWNEAKTVATLTVDHKFVAATYNLTVTGVAEEALTASVTTTREVVSEIKFNSDKLVLTGAKKTVGSVEYNEARITFDVYNQYGEVITDSVPTSYYTDEKLRGLKSDDSFTFSESSKGLIVLWVDKDEDEGEEGTISFTYEYNDVEIDVDQNVVLSDELEPGAVSVKGIYNINDREFTSENVEEYYPEEEFFLLLEVKDQFGNPIDAKSAQGARNGATATSADTAQYIFNSVQKGIRTSVSNKNIFEVDEDDLSVENVDGKYYFAIPLTFEFDNGYVEETGENTVTVRSKATGDVSESKITLSDSSKLYSIGLSAPVEVVAANEKVLLPVTAVDQDGNAITDAAKLNKDKNEIGTNKITISAKGNGERLLNNDFTFVNKDGAVFLEFNSVGNPRHDRNVEMDISVEVESTKQESELTLQIQPKAYAANLVKISDKFNTNVYATQDFDLELADLVIEDQYGRVIDEVKGREFYVKIKKSSAAAVGANFKASQPNYFATTVDTTSLAFANVKAFLGDVAPVSNDETTLNAGIEKANATFDFELVSTDNQGKLITSTLSTTFRTVEQETFKSYKVKGESKGYAISTEDTVDFEVYGVTSAGKEVLLSKDAYQVLPSKFFIKPAGFNTELTEAQVSIDTVEAATELSDTVKSFKTGIQVVINRTGEVLSHEVTLTTEAPDYASLSLKDFASISGKQLTEVKVSDSLDTTTDEYVLTATDIFNAIDADAVIKVTDQYGLEYKESGTSVTTTDLFNQGEFKFTISNINASSNDYKILGNGSQLLEITKGADKIDSFDLTVKIGDAVKTLKVRVQ